MLKYLPALALAIFGIYWFGSAKNSHSNSTEARYVAPTPALTHFTLGYDDLMADILWLRLIQDYGVCEQQRATPGSVRVGPNRTADCSKGWVYQMLDVITELAPKFRMPYASGVVALSVMADDIDGATLLIEKAAKHFSTDWQILYRGAYHYIYELGDEKRAAELLTQAGNSGGPFWLHSLAARMYSQSGKAQLGQSVLTDYLKNYGDRLSKERRQYLEKRLRELSAEARQVEP